MTDPVIDVWALLWKAALDDRDANPNYSESRLIDVLLPIVTAYGAECAAQAWDEGFDAGYMYVQGGDQTNPYAEEIP